MHHVVRSTRTGRAARKAFTIDKASASAIFGEPEFKVSIRPQWVDIDEVDFATIGAVLTKVVVKVGKTAAEASFLLDQTRITFKAVDTSAGDAAKRLVKVHCLRTL